MNSCKVSSFMENWKFYEKLLFSKTQLYNNHLYSQAKISYYTISDLSDIISKAFFCIFYLIHCYILLLLLRNVATTYLLIIILSNVVQFICLKNNRSSYDFLMFCEEFSFKWKFCKIQNKIFNMTILSTQFHQNLHILPIYVGRYIQVQVFPKSILCFYFNKIINFIILLKYDTNFLARDLVSTFQWYYLHLD